MEREEEHAAAPAEIEPLSTSRKKNKDKNKRRFSDEQIRLLETIFESETKLEPNKKVQLARELCLQPRQVAIWFQNRRARWKSRQIEQEYRALKANYDKLASQFESLKEENQSLILQLEKLSELVGKSHDGNRRIKDSERHSTDGSSDNWGTNCETEAKACFLPKGLDLDHRGVMFEDNDQSKNIEYSEDGAQELLNMGEYVDYASVSPEKWYSFESGGLFDQSCNSANWMNFWT